MTRFASAMEIAFTSPEVGCGSAGELVFHSGEARPCIDHDQALVPVTAEGPSACGCGLVAHPKAIDFGAVAVDPTRPPTELVSVTNTDTAPHFVRATTAGSLHFEVRPVNISCDLTSGELLEPGEACSLSVEYSPVEVGHWEEGIQLMATDQPDCAPVDVLLSGDGV